MESFFTRILEGKILVYEAEGIPIHEVLSVASFVTSSLFIQQTPFLGRSFCFLGGGGATIRSIRKPSRGEFSQAQESNPSVAGGNDGEWY